MSFSIDWFERLCQEFSRNPVNASKFIEQLRDSDIAIDAAESVLVTPSTTLVAKFQAVSILQYACLNKWNVLSETRQNSLKAMVFSLISATSSGFYQNKAIQTYVLLWKRSWLGLNDTGRDVFFAQVSDLLKSHEQIRVGALIIKTTVEEFASRNFAEVNIQYDFHIKVKNVFQSNNLHSVYQLTIASLGVLVTSFVTQSIDSLYNNQLLLFSELIKVLNDIINWDYDDFNAQALPSNIINKIPKEWSMYLLNIQFMEGIFTLYEKFRQLKTTFKTQNNELDACLTESRNIILSLASINGEIFKNDVEKIGLADFILNKLLSIVETVQFESNIDIRQLSESGGNVAEDLDVFINTTLRLIGNFKLRLISQTSNFEKLMMTIGKLTNKISSEVEYIAKQFLEQLTIAMKNDQDQQVANIKSFYDTGLLNTWRGDLLSLFLDAWSIILDDPSILQCIEQSNPVYLPPQNAKNNNNNNNVVTLSPQFLHWLKTISQELFNIVFETLLKIYVIESILCVDENEDEEEAVIDARTVEDMLTGICTIGRANFTGSLTLLGKYLQENLITFRELATNQTINSSLWSQMNFKCLETFRIIFLFLSYLLIDNFQLDSAAMDNETPILNTFIVTTLFLEPNTSNLLKEILRIINETLALQGEFFVNSHTNHRYQGMLSPLLIQLIYRIYTEYILRYVDVDQSNYRLKTGIYIHGDEINQTFELLLNCSQQVLLHLSMENDVVRDIAEVIKSLSRVHNDNRLKAIVHWPVTSSIAQIVIGSFEGKICRMNSMSIIAMSEAIGSLFIRSKQEGFVGQFCGAVYALLDPNKGLPSKVQIERTISCLSGLAKCPSGCDNIIHNLFDASFVILVPAILTYFDCDDILKLYLNLLVNYTEYQLVRLNNKSCFELYKVSYNLLEIYVKRFELTDKLQDTLNGAEYDLFRSESCYNLLILLNHLALKDFAFTEDCSDEFNKSFEDEIAMVLLYGLQVLIPVITVEILKSFPNTAEKYFSFVSFVSSCYLTNFIRWINSLPEDIGQNRLMQIIQHLLWCVANSLDGATARHAFQALQNIGINQYKCKTNQAEGFSLILQNNVMNIIIDRLLEMIIQSNTNKHYEFALSWDRMDSFANTLIIYIALNFERFQYCVNMIVSKQNNTLQPILLECFNKLVSNNNVQITSIEKKNRILFIKNFREFIVQIKSLKFSNV